MLTTRPAFLGTLPPPLQGEGWGGDGLRVNGTHPPPNLPLEEGVAIGLLINRKGAKTQSKRKEEPMFSMATLCGRSLRLRAFAVDWPFCGTLLKGLRCHDSSASDAG